MIAEQRLMLRHCLPKVQDRVVQRSAVSVLPQQPARPLAGNELDPSQVAVRHDRPRLVVLDRSRRDPEKPGQLRLSEIALSPRPPDSRSDALSPCAFHDSYL